MYMHKLALWFFFCFPSFDILIRERRGLGQLASQVHPHLSQQAGRVPKLLIHGEELLTHLGLALSSRTILRFLDNKTGIWCLRSTTFHPLEEPTLWWVKMQLLLTAGDLMLQMVVVYQDHLLESLWANCSCRSYLQVRLWTGANGW